MFNFEVWKDFLNIIYPIFLYRQIVTKTHVQGQQIECEEGQQNMNYINPFESIYEFKGSYIESVEAKEKPIGIQINVGLAYCLYRQSTAVSPKQVLIL